MAITCMRFDPELVKEHPVELTIIMTWWDRLESS